MRPLSFEKSGSGFSDFDITTVDHLVSAAMDFISHSQVPPAAQ
jgi:hypothetical protein